MSEDEAKQNAASEEQTVPEPRQDRASAKGADGAEVEVEEVEDPEYQAALKKIAQNTPNVLWHHPAKFTSYEDKIIAAGLIMSTPIYKICETLRCGRSQLMAHIEADEDLKRIREEAKGRELDKLEEGISELVDMRHPSILMWKAEKLLPQKYGKDRPPEEEDETRIVLGELSDEDIAKADRLLAEAASKPPEVGLAALLDVEAQKKVEATVNGGQDTNSVPTLSELNGGAPQQTPVSDPDTETTVSIQSEREEEGVLGLTDADLPPDAGFADNLGGEWL